MTEDLATLARQYMDTSGEYTDPYERDKLIRDWQKKVEVAKNVVGDFQKRAGNIKEKKILDIGFGNGEYAIAFARAGAVMSGVEVTPVLFDIAKKRAEQSGEMIDLRLYDGRMFPFLSNSFDHLYSISVLEHVTDPQFFLSEAARVLKANGHFYLTFPNRLRLKETHTGVYGLSYLPRTWARFFLRMIWKRNTINDINLHFISFYSMKRMAKRAGFRIVFAVEGSGWRRKVKNVLASCRIHHSAFLGTVMVVLEKR